MSQYSRNVIAKAVPAWTVMVILVYSLVVLTRGEAHASAQQACDCDEPHSEYDNDYIPDIRVSVPQDVDSE